VVISERGSLRQGLDRQLRGPNPKLMKRSIKRSKSVVDLLLFGDSNPSSRKVENYRTKNIRQTELIITLRDAILRIAQYFQAADPSCISNEVSYYYFAHFGMVYWSELSVTFGECVCEQMRRPRSDLCY